MAFRTASRYASFVKLASRPPGRPERVAYATTSAIPDFVLWEGKVALEVKLLRDAKDLPRITSEINDDILKYGDRFSQKVFLVYDCGTLRDVEEFRRAFMSHRGVFVLVVKH